MLATARLYIVFLAVGRLFGAEDSRAVLLQIAERYRTLQSFGVQIHTVAEDKGPEAPKTVFDLHLAADLPDAICLQKKISQPVKEQLDVCRETRAVWASSRKNRSYTKGSMGSNQAAFLKEHETRYIDRFRDLDRLEAEAEIGIAPCPQAHAESCWRIRLSSLDKLWDEDLWVDRATGLVQRSVLHNKELFTRTKTITTWHWESVDRIHDEATYVPHIPANYRLTNALQLY